MKRIIFIAAVFSMVTACVNTGVIEGVSDGQAVQFDYEQDFFENDGQLSITMPDGERYSGKFVQGSSSTSGNDWEIGESSDDDTWVLTDSTTVSSRTEALLIGNRGSTMKCKIQLSNPGSGLEGGGIDGGGIGSCRTSKDQQIAITF